MSAELPTGYTNESLASGPQSALERRLIREYLHSKGFSFSDLRRLPKEEARRLMEQACKYASLKLAEVQSRAQFREDIRGPA